MRWAEFGIHVDEVVAKKKKHWRLKDLDGLGMGGLSNDGGESFHSKFEKGGK